MTGKRGWLYNPAKSSGDDNPNQKRMAFICILEEHSKKTYNVGYNMCSLSLIHDSGI